MIEPKYPIPVFQQPAESFAKWVALGFNAVINPVFGLDQQCKTGAEVVAAAHAAGLYTITADPAGDAWNHPDECDGKGITPEACQTQYAAWKAVAPSKPVWMNLDGRRRQFTTLATYQAYAAATDWLGMDRYPVSTGEVQNIPLIGGDIEMIRQAGPAKKLFYIFEASNQHIDLSAWGQTMPPAQRAACRPATGKEMLQELNLPQRSQLAASGFFTHDPYGNNGGWASFDSTSPESRMTISQFAASKNPPVNPPQPVHSVIIDGVTYVPATK